MNSKLFPSNVVNAARKAQQLTGVPVAISLAQWALESGFGKKVTGDYNYWGIKWKGNPLQKWKLCPTKEWKMGRFWAVLAKFASFSSMEAGFLEHGRLLMDPKGRYTAAHSKKDNWRAFLYIIAPIYATDPKYYEKIVKLVETYQLDRY